MVDDEKLRVVAECLAGLRLVSSTARRHGITRSQLMAWRRVLKVERVAPEPTPMPVFVPAVVVPEPAIPAKAAPRQRRPQQAAQGRMAIEVGRGRRAVVVDGAVDAEALARVLDVLDRGREAWLLAGSNRGGRRAAFFNSLIVTAKLNDVDPQAWLADVLGRIASHPAQRLGELLPWNWKPIPAAPASLDAAA